MDDAEEVSSQTYELKVTPSDDEIKDFRRDSDHKRNIDLRDFLIFFTDLRTPLSRAHRPLL